MIFRGWNLHGVGGYRYNRDCVGEVTEVSVGQVKSVPQDIMPRARQTIDRGGPIG